MLNKVSLESTKSTVVSEIVGGESTVNEAAKASFVNSLRGLPLAYNTELLKKVDRASLDEVKAALKEYVERLFHEEPNFVIVGSKDKVAQIVSGFDKELQKKVEKFDSVEAFFTPQVRDTKCEQEAAKDGMGFMTKALVMVGVAALVGFVYMRFKK